MKNDEIEGKGIYYFSNGEIYEGEFKKGLYDGKGILYQRNNIIYDGMWKMTVKMEKEVNISLMVIYMKDFGKMN